MAALDGQRTAHDYLWPDPTRFSAYARIYHPIERDRPATERSWIGLDMYEYIRNSPVTGNKIERELCSWATAAQAFGTHMHPQAQYPLLTKQDPHNTEPKVAPDGWSYSTPKTGNLIPPTLSILASVLALHTTTPHSGVAAVWEGYGRLIDSGRGAKEPGTGVLPREIALGPRLSLDGGTWNYFLFGAGASAFVEDSWVSRSPWIDTHFEQSPTYLWPDDQAWALHTNVDLDSSIIGGSEELINQLLQTPGIEALPLPTDLLLLPL
ncbi:hypothetical protein V5R04_12515 [Jonesiaceae bacterium BS-20]|uniref:RHS repeat-associated core domain-containing protein n=1 Tax=Jonesiaceae bacterium BS-20 TaxID=3120821 RepID=A0AAU7DTM8_9MICO